MEKKLRGARGVADDGRLYIIKSLWQQKTDLENSLSITEW
jgi:hypothetical protein